MDGRVRATYPMARLVVGEQHVPVAVAGFGVADQAGVYEGTFTRIELFRAHLRKQFTRIFENHGGPIEVGLSDTPIPLPFAFPDGMVVGDGFDAVAMTRRSEGHTSELQSLMRI